MKSFRAALGLTAIAIMLGMTVAVIKGVHKVKPRKSPFDLLVSPK